MVSGRRGAHVPRLMYHRPALPRAKHDSPSLDPLGLGPFSSSSHDPQNYMLARLLNVVYSFDPRNHHFGSAPSTSPWNARTRIVWRARNAECHREQGHETSPDHASPTAWSIRGRILRYIVHCLTANHAFHEVFFWCGTSECVDGGWNKVSRYVWPSA